MCLELYSSNWGWGGEEVVNAIDGSMDGWIDGSMDRWMEGNN